jgi:hypothetical protein
MVAGLGLGGVQVSQGKEECFCGLDYQRRLFHLQRIANEYNQQRNASTAD